MAYDKIIPIRRRLDHCLDYALAEEKSGLTAALGYIGDKDKTGGGVLQTALNCGLTTAHTEMKATKRRWDKRGGVLGYHIIHSYAPGEVTPQEAHAAGVEFARRLLGDRYEAVVATHVDREHLHCHIVFNSVSFVDGRKYRNDFKAYFGDIRETSNEVSRAHGLSIIEPEDGGGGKHYSEWHAEREGKPTLRGLVRQDIDAALLRAYDLHSLWATLERQGYQVKRGERVKHTALKPPGAERFFRLDSLGEGYTEAELTRRLTHPEPPKVNFPTLKAPSKRYVVQGRLAGIVGGGVLLVALCVILLVAAVVSSPFGIFFSNENPAPGAVTTREVVAEVNAEYAAKIETLQAGSYDSVEMNGAPADWRDVLAVFAVKTAGADDGMDVATLDPDRAARLKAVFWDMTTISHYVQTIRHPDRDPDDGVDTSWTERILHITVTGQTADEAAAAYGFTQDQHTQLAELQAPENSDLWLALLYGISMADGQIVSVALSQVGNVGGQPYWSWYGFNSRVEWCACFVSWCANECGYIDAGTIY